MKNVAMSSVTGSGWTLCYNATYATATTSANINACKGAAYVLLPRPPTRRALAEARGIGEAGGLWHVLLLCVTWGFLEWKAEQAFQTTSTLLPSPPSCRPISGWPLPLTFSFGCWARPRSVFLFLVGNEGLWCEWGDGGTGMDSWSARRAGQWLGQGPWHRRLGRSGPAPSP